jgi:hypothetical protein
VRADQTSRRLGAWLIDLVLVLTPTLVVAWSGVGFWLTVVAAALAALIVLRLYPANTAGRTPGQHLLLPKPQLLLPKPQLLLPKSQLRPAPDPSALDPEWSDDLGAWFVVDPETGHRFHHDPGTGRWLPVA